MKSWTNNNHSCRLLSMIFFENALRPEAAKHSKVITSSWSDFLVFCKISLPTLDTGNRHNWWITGSLVQDVQAKSLRLTQLYVIAKQFSWSSPFLSDFAKQYLWHDAFVWIWMVSGLKYFWKQIETVVLLFLWTPSRTSECYQPTMFQQLAVAMEDDFEYASK